MPMRKQQQQSGERKRTEENVKISFCICMNVTTDGAHKAVKENYNDEKESASELRSVLPW